MWRHRLTAAWLPVIYKIDMCHDAEAIFFCRAVAVARPVLVMPEQARRDIEVHMAADRSAESNAPVELPPAAGPAQLALVG